MIRKILFICHGNICRSPMAEMILRQLAEEQGAADGLRIDSAAVSTEELGNGIYPPAAAELRRQGIAIRPHRARQMTAADAEEYDLLIGMDRMNLRGMARLTGGIHPEKLRLLGEWSDGREIGDPWYTDRFDQAYRQIRAGCEGLLRALTQAE